MPSPDELTQFFNEPVFIFSRGDGDEHHHVVGEVVEAVGVREDDERWCKTRYTWPIHGRCGLSFRLSEPADWQ